MATPGDVGSSTPVSRDRRPNGPLNPFYTAPSGGPGGGATEQTLRDVKRHITDYRVLLDYDVRTDTNPVYIGKNAQAAAKSDADWTIQRITYDGSARLVDAQALVGVWDDRATLGWS